MAIKKLELTDEEVVEEKEEFLSEEEIQRAVANGEQEILRIKAVLNLLFESLKDMTFGSEILGLDETRNFIAKALYSCEEVYPRFLTGEIEPILNEDLEGKAREQALKEVEEVRIKIFEKLLNNKNY